jgi:hypothetical protein
MVGLASLLCKPCSARTMVKNYVHALLEKHKIRLASRIFWARERSWLMGLKLPDNDGLVFEFGFR